jgi:hypothetical protein
MDAEGTKVEEGSSVGFAEDSAVVGSAVGLAVVLVEVVSDGGLMSTPWLAQSVLAAARASMVHC